MRLSVLCLMILLVVAGCNNGKQSSVSSSPVAKEYAIEYATAFRAKHSGDTIILEVTRPWPGAEKIYTYYLVPEIAQSDPEKNLIKIPLERLVVSSTTHIPSLDMLGASKNLVGFPNLDYISSSTIRSRIDSGKVRDVGNNESLNTEVLISLQPDAVVGFAVDGAPSAYTSVQQAGIPVLYNADWTETHPLGKAEWIKFFGLLLGKRQKADSIFNEIKESYLRTSALARQSPDAPTVLSGAMYRDVWYCPSGESWAAQFLTDANARYLWKDTGGSGSLSLSLEAVLEKGQEADFWIGPGQFTSYSALAGASPVYTQFSAFKDKKVYTFSKRKGPTGGVLYYELAPNRPDLVLRDLVQLLHPGLLPDSQTYFFDPLDP